MWCIVQAGRKDDITIERYRDAIALAHRMIVDSPDKMLGVFLFGSGSAVLWHFGAGFPSPPKEATA